MSTLTVRDGFAADSGGCIQNFGQLTLNRVAVRGCYSDWAGGGIANYGKLTLLDSQIVGNETYTTGGGVYNEAEARVKMTRTTVSENFSWAVFG